MHSLLLTALTMAMALWLPASARAGALEDLQKSYNARHEAANAQRNDQLAKLDISYLAALKRHLDQTQASGELDTVLPILDEIQAVRAVKDPLPALPANAGTPLTQLRAKHRDARDQILKSHAQALVALADIMLPALKNQEVELTKAGQIADAVAAKQLRESLANDERIQAARDLLKFAAPADSARPALRLRRYGDHLEVLVFYDRRGKVSMDSPVQNVREETGAKKDLGDTQAKVLGEFVVAKGYQVDPFISCHPLQQPLFISNGEFVAE